MFRWDVIYHWKALDESYNFALNLTSIGSLYTKLWDSKVAKVLILRISRLPLGSPGTKWHLGASLVAKNRVRWWLPPSPGRGESYESMFAYSSSVHQKCSNYVLTNLLFGLCRSVWVIELLVHLPSLHPKVPAHFSTPDVLWVRERAPTPFPFVIYTFGLVMSP
jgi:hypothetical protein